ncbi:MAG: hypothetical protein RMM17_04690 [Acidobacteriota bacterium]|nr:hypothetical protein [Blastocatellia bacterium]MDW8411961.1 hypothetical protein [Acidobacteriota bacterium]
MERYFDNLEDLARWATAHAISVISIDAHKCLTVNGSVKYGLSCKAYLDQSRRAQFNTSKFSDPSLMDKEADKIERKLRSFGLRISRTPLPV